MKSPLSDRLRIMNGGSGPSTMPVLAELHRLGYSRCDPQRGRQAVTWIYTHLYLHSQCIIRNKSHRNQYCFHVMVFRTGVLKLITRVQFALWHAGLTGLCVKQCKFARYLLIIENLNHSYLPLLLEAWDQVHRMLMMQWRKKSRQPQGKALNLNPWQLQCVEVASRTKQGCLSKGKPSNEQARELICVSCKTDRTGTPDSAYMVTELGTKIACNERTKIMHIMSPVELYRSFLGLGRERVPVDCNCHWFRLLL